MELPFIMMQHLTRQFLLAFSPSRKQKRSTASRPSTPRRATSAPQAGTPPRPRRGRGVQQQTSDRDTAQAMGTLHPSAKTVPLQVPPPNPAVENSHRGGAAKVQPSNVVLPRLSIRGRELTISAGPEWHADEHTKIDVLTVCADVLKIYEDMLPMGPICGKPVVGLLLISLSSRHVQP